MSSQLLIFDLDGTLVDTTDQVNEITARLLQSAGVLIEAADVASSLSLNSLSAYAKLEGLSKAYGVEIAEDNLGRMAALHEEQKRALYEKGDFHVFEGVADCLNKLQKNYTLAIGSNSPTSASVQALSAAGLLPFFAGCIYGPDNTGGVSKPAPDVFIQAALKSGFDPKDAIVIGDSLTDLEAAARAGIPCYMFVRADEDSDIQDDYKARGCEGFFTTYKEFSPLGNKCNSMSRQSLNPACKF